MKSTVVPAYARQSLPSGEIALTYNYISAANILTWVLGTVLIGAVAANTHYVLLFNRIPVTSEVITLLGFVGVPTWIAGYWAYIKYQRAHVFVKPGEGIRVGRTLLPFNEVDTLGVYQRNKGGYVYAESKGTRIQLTRMIKQPTASAIAHELRQLSGSRWS